jgi:hypothetical protein
VVSAAEVAAAVAAAAATVSKKNIYNEFLI